MGALVFSWGQADSSAGGSRPGSRRWSGRIRVYGALRMLLARAREHDDHVRRHLQGQATAVRRRDDSAGQDVREDLVQWGCQPEQLGRLELSFGRDEASDHTITSTETAMVTTPARSTVGSRDIAGSPPRLSAIRPVCQELKTRPSGGRLSCGTSP